MKVKKLEVGPIGENCYILEKNNECLIIDPGDEFDNINYELNNKKVVEVLVTHAHFDHIGALKEVLDKYNVNLYYNNINNEIKYKKIVNIEEKEYTIGNFKFEVIYTKGHRNDLCTFYFKEENIMFTGDFLFYLSVGRVDMEYSSKKDMLFIIEK